MFFGNARIMLFNPNSSPAPGPATHADTWYKYAGDTEWRTVSINGAIEGGFDEDSGMQIATTQIPDIYNVVALEIGTDVTSIGGYAFDSCDITSVTIPDNVTSIGESAFRDNNINNLTIGNGVTTIDLYTFANCTRLTSVVIPNNVSIIADSAFEYCTGLTSVTMPDSVTSIGSSAFYNCTSLTTVTIVATGKPGASAANVKQAMIDAGVDPNITWNGVD